MSPLFSKRPPAPAGGGGIEAAIPMGGVKQEKPQPKTGVETIVQQAPQVLPQLEQVTHQKEAEARQTIDMLEKARAEKGNFCVTLGTGPDRAVVLTAPTTREWKAEIDSYGAHYKYDETFTDYVLITPKGPRRVSFLTEVREGNKEFIGKAQKSMGLLKEALGTAARGNGVIERARYWESVFQDNTSMTLDIPRPDRKPTDRTDEERDLYHSTDYKLNGYEGASKVGPITDEAIVEQAVRASLEQTQSPIKAQITQVRGEIGALQGVRKGLS